jgi:DNA helicase-2/ATP-dependent DNA helicase PcrA
LDDKVQGVYQEELLRLEQTSKVIDDQLERLRDIPSYYGSDVTEQVLDSMREQTRNNLAKAVNEAYFGRLDFQESGKDASSSYYIGKAGVEDEIGSGKLLVIDWRAPVASLFYSFSGGSDSTAYHSPDGLIEGLVYLKRNVVIRKQILQRVVDTYDREQDSLSAHDEFLLYRLGENKDNKLRDIVSTIQAEQDKIIRAAKNSALIIQGVAGSGKTTVALHRLAFLLYQYRDQIRAENMIIFAPNHMFLDYISTVLPELGVGNIQQSTFADWAMDILEQEVKLADPDAALKTWFAVGPGRPEINELAPGRFKGSLRFKDYLDQCLIRFEDTYVPSSSFQPWEGKLLPLKTIQEWFFVENKHYPLAKRRDRVVARIKRWLEMELDKIWLMSRKKEMKQKSSQKLRAYLKDWPEHTAFSVYKLVFLGSIQPKNREPDQLQEIPSDISEAAQKLFKKTTVQPEDLAPLLYIHNRLYGIPSDRKFDHTVVDEAQDFSPFQIAILNEYTRSGSFTILGDLSQGIHAYQGIMDWNEFRCIFSEEQSGYFELERSYRSTMEIIQFANAVLARGGPAQLLAVPVFRSGDKVRVIQTKKSDRLQVLLQALNRIREGSSSTIAIITRTDKHSEQLYEALQEAGIPCQAISSRQREYKGGISVLPVYLAKGLEFDAVLLMDVDAEHYARNIMDAKLLYVGCTRCLHELWLLYSGEPSPLIDLQNEENITTEFPQ